MVVPCLVLAWALLVALFDWRRQRVPNVLLLPVFVVALLAVVIDGQTVLGAGRWSGFAGMIVAAAPWMVGYGLRQVGAGDVKFAATLGLLAGLPMATLGTLAAALLAGLISLQLRRWGGRGLRFPLAPALLLGFVLAFGIEAGFWR